jgi:hypothetical protein
VQSEDDGLKNGTGGLLHRGAAAMPKNHEGCRIQ